jgi:hypothetical protein
MDIAYKKIADIIKGIVDPCDNLDYSLDSINSLLSHLNEHENKFITISNNVAIEEDVDTPMKVTMFPNPNAMGIDFKDKINEQLVFGIRSKKHVHGYKKELSKKAYDIAIKLIDIKGIDHLHIDRYDITIFKVKLYKWEEIKDTILNAIREVLFKEEI